MRKILFFLLFSVLASAQSDSLNRFKFSAFGELYYSYDFSEPANHEKSPLVYNYKRHNEFNANLLLLKGSYAEKNVRANLGLMYGTYAHYNLSAEPQWAQMIYEANVGVKLSPSKELWLDAGILPSHIGSESAVGMDNPTLTRSIVAENSPYYETGMRLSYASPSGKWYWAGLVLNGWQKIKKPDGIQKPSFGTQITYKPTEKVLLNYSNFIGADQPDSLKIHRVYHDFYAQLSPSEKISIVAGVDVGTDFGSSASKTWFSPLVIAKYHLDQKSDVAFRAEYFEDAHQTVVVIPPSTGLHVAGYSLNYDRRIGKNILFRIEGKNYHSQEPIFQGNKKDNWSVTGALAVKL